MRELTELTPEPCHILFSASMGTVRGQGTEKRRSLSERSHVALGEMAPQPADAEGPKPDSRVQGWSQKNGLPLAEE